MRVKAFTTDALADALVTLLPPDGKELKRFYTDSYSGELIQILRRPSTTNPHQFQYAITAFAYGTCSYCDAVQSLQELQEEKQAHDARVLYPDTDSDEYYDAMRKVTDRAPMGTFHDELKQMVRTVWDTATWRTYAETTEWLLSRDDSLMPYSMEDDLDTVTDIIMQSEGIDLTAPDFVNPFSSIIDNNDNDNY